MGVVVQYISYKEEITSHKILQERNNFVNQGIPKEMLSGEELVTFSVKND